MHLDPSRRRLQDHMGLFEATEHLLNGGQGAVLLQSIKPSTRAGGEGASHGLHGQIVSFVRVIRNRRSLIGGEVGEEVIEGLALAVLLALEPLDVGLVLLDLRLLVLELLHDPLRYG